MDWTSRLRSFPVLAALAVLCSFGLGWLLALVFSADPGPLPGVQQPEPRHDARQYDEPVVRGPGEIPDVEPPTDDPPSGEATAPKDESGRRDPDPEPVKEIEGGDKIERPTSLPEATSSLSVFVTMPDGRPQPNAMLRLEVDAGPAGWMIVRDMAERTERAGELLFSGVYPGAYRVTSVTLGYVRVSTEITIYPGDRERSVDLRLELSRYGRALFAPSLPDGTHPEFVYVRMTRDSDAEGATTGRLRTYETASNGKNGNERLIRYRVPDAGSIAFAVESGRETSFLFLVDQEKVRYEAEITILGDGDTHNYDVLLQATEKPADEDLAAGRTTARLELRFVRTDGGSLSLTRANLRNSPTADSYQMATQIDGATAVWERVLTGRWYVVAEFDEYRAPFVSELRFSDSTNVDFDVTPGSLVLEVARDSDSPVVEGGMAYRIRLLPMGSGALESSANLTLEGKSDAMNWLLPPGDYEIRLHEREGSGVAGEPSSFEITVASREEATASFMLRAAALVTLQCVDAFGTPVAGAECLVTTTAAAALTQSHAEQAVLAGADGSARIEGAPFGKVYVHVWVASTDLNKPDKTFVVDLPAYGYVDLGAVVVK